MADSSEKIMGGFGIVSLISGIISLFLGGLLSVFIGFSAVVTGFWGAKKQESFSQAGMIIGSFSLIFFNLITIGIVSTPSSLTSDRAHLINSINSSIKAFTVLQKGKMDDQKKDEFINFLKDGLEEAQMINIGKIKEPSLSIISFIKGIVTK